MQFVPLTDVLDDMAGKFVDEECRSQCFDLTVRSNDEVSVKNSPPNSFLFVLRRIVSWRIDIVFFRK